ncbi:hypothetical protein [Oceanidesulfovibrio marinus]|uniref:Carboxypeptidase regulatory-like domain-containing protein n=1 Tax=Oceanidesulfovibrio marinus TaxID=370038 RepID=A0A6P1ZM54_9BACT|nr:hypothetical protein [Oceanidesulfovibrio marinus]TVM36600.1 hypothetical protein DQK91_01365 [Oceanidesulfovibrio marinus]
MMKRLSITLMACALVVAFAAPSFAQDPSRCLIITYDYVSNCRAVSGGFGKSQRDAMRAMEKDFDIKLIFALSSGQYLGDVGVVITKGDEVVMDAVSDGPWFMADLPDGTYDVTATYEGVSNSATFTVGNKLTTKIMKWDPKAVGFEPLTTGE